ncbi:hypothetical protein H6P81_006484 [Aristolochia fimbriata]|uniref:Generative cell specific-1/HAP2 domain-containing protein n=1 Tax=Aristolochia fimbriata TaxID=158543 RepID=A0AAV7EZL5_ARIFI|nr:hypothetical protein H6P81_006484 [Aristolochia fimbriata]
MSWLKNFENESISFWEGSGNGKGSGAYIMVNATKGLFISWHSFLLMNRLTYRPVNRYCLETQLLTFAYANPLVKSEELGIGLFLRSGAAAIRVEILLKSKIEKCEKHSDLDKVGLQAKDCSELGKLPSGRLFAVPADQGVGLRPHAETFERPTLPTVFDFHKTVNGWVFIPLGLNFGDREVVVGPKSERRLSNDNFLRVHLFGDFVGYTSIPSFEDLYLVIPRRHSPTFEGFQDRPHENLGRNFSMWMLLERVRFLDGIECDKIGVSTFEALTQFGTATITTRNIGTLEASYKHNDQRFDRSKGIGPDGGGLKLKKPLGVRLKSIQLQIGPLKYECLGCSDTGTRKDGMNGFFDAIRGIRKTIWGYFVDFFSPLSSCCGCYIRKDYLIHFFGGRIDLVRGGGKSGR